MGIAEPGSIFLWLPRRCSFRSSRPLSFGVELTDIGVTQSPVSSSLAFQRRDNPNGGILERKVKRTDRSFEFQTESRNSAEQREEVYALQEQRDFIHYPFSLHLLFPHQKLPDPVAIPLQVSAAVLICHGPVSGGCREIFGNPQWHPILGFLDQT